MAEESKRWVEGDPAKTLSNQEKYVLDNYSSVKAVFDDCSSLIAKVRRDLMAKPPKLGKAKDILLKLEARIKKADESRNIWDEKDLPGTLSKQEKYVIDNYSSVKAVFDDCSSLIAKARDLVGKTDRVGELTDILLKLEARIQTADKSKELLDKKRIKYGILAYNLCFAIIALGVGWWAICGPYLPCRSCDNSTQSAVATPAPQSSGQASVQGPEQNPAGNPMEKIKALTLVNWLVLGFAAGTLGGAMVGIYGLIYHGIRGDFSSDYLVWYWSKPFKGGLSGLVAILPFMAGLAVFKIESAVEVQTTIAYITVVSFLTGYNERYFLQLLNTVGKTVFGPGETNGGTDSAITKPG